MNTQPIARNTGRAAALLTGLILMAPATQAEARPLRIDGIDTVTKGSMQEVRIRTAHKPTYSVFRLTQPFRVLVDIRGGALKAPFDLRRVNQGLVRYIATDKLTDGQHQVLRVETALTKAAPYDVSWDGEAIVVRVGSPTQPAVPAKAADNKAKLGAFSLKKRGADLLLEAPIRAGALSPSAVSIEELANPSRLVVDLAGAQVEPKWQRLSVKGNGVKQARVANKPGAVRFVLDVQGDKLPSLDVKQQAGKLRLVISKAKLSAAPAPTRAAQAPKARPAARSTALVKDIRFERRDGFVRFIVELEGKAEAAAETGKAAPRLRIAGAQLPKSLERTLDVNEVAAGILSSLSSYAEGADTVLSANISPNTEHRHWRRGSKLMWDFRNAEQRAKVLRYGKEATAGFKSSVGTQAAAKLSPKKRYTGRRISLDLKDAEVQNVLRLLADVSKLNIVAAEDVKGRVTIKLRNVPWDQALDIILAAKGLDKVRSGNIIRVAPAEVLQREEQLRLDRRKAKMELEPLMVRLIPVSYAVASEIQPQVTALLSPRGKVNVDVRTNVLVVEDIESVLMKAQRLVRTLDTQTPQVLIEARIVEATSNFSRSLGIQWGGQVNMTQEYGNATGLGNMTLTGGADDSSTNVYGVSGSPSNYAVNLPAAVGSGAGGALGFSWGAISDTLTLNLRISAAASQDKAKLVSAPKVVTLDNKEATILSGEKVPITITSANGPTTRFIDADLSLKVTPHVTQEGSILLNIEAKKNELSSRTDNTGVPGILTKEATTQMIVRDGDTAVLGGIYRSTASETEAYVPWLGKLPILGWLFKTNTVEDTRDEMLIFISPRIVNRDQALINPNGK